MVLYAPIIDPAVPAFAGKTLTVNFENNAAINLFTVEPYLYLKMVDYSTGKSLLKEDSPVQSAKIIDFQQGQAQFSLTSSLFADAQTLTAGNFYKVQIAYADSNGVGPFSTIGITRYLGESSSIAVSVLGLDDDNDNKHRITYQGSYSYTAAGLTENVYQYRFRMLFNQTVIEDSGWLIPTRLSDGNIEMDYTFENELQYFNKYTLDFTVQTINGYQKKTQYNIVKAGLYPTDLTGATLFATQSYQAKENGYVEVGFEKGGRAATGKFRLIRQAYGEQNWEELTTCDMSKEDDISQFQWRDYSVEQGQCYTYGFQQLGKQGEDGAIYYSTPLLAIIKEVEFEHMYLGDDQYQLKIAFNPQVSSFKETVLENKVDTIGGQYPTFFRNGNVKYAEIPISGLLSYLLDDGYFLPISKLYPGALNLDGSQKYDTISLTNYNFASERQFKMAVLQWLNNGKPKLFRSPAEGNYVLRLMNVNISPNAQVGRMLHTFSATGYEIMPASPKAMLNAYDSVLSFNKIASQNTGSDGGFGDKAANSQPDLKTNRRTDITLESGAMVIALSLHGGNTGGKFTLTYYGNSSRELNIAPKDSAYFSIADLHQLEKIVLEKNKDLSYDIYYLQLQEDNN